ncbi:MAG TPA: DNA polymerase III subunit alpha [Mesotoga infera]|nr:DNA polymerase III subunit alpha [Mesotoga infera]
MKTAFIVTSYDLYQSVLLPEETARELERHGYRRCVIIDRTLASFVKWSKVLARHSITTLPGIREGESYRIARNMEGFRELIAASKSESPNIIRFEGRPKNLDPASPNPIWETRYLSRDRKKFEIYSSLRGIDLDGDYSLPDKERYETLRNGIERESNLPESFSLKPYTQTFPEKISPENFRALLSGRLSDRTAEEKYLSRLDREVSVICLKSIQDYFMTVSRIVSLAREIGCWIGPGRGSAAGSLVSYLLGITRVDPVKEGLYFERFLSVKRDDPPDIDIDVEDRMRQELLRKLRDFFGDDRFCLIRTASTFGFKGAAREIGRRLGIDEARISHLIDWSNDGKRFPRSFERDEEMRKLFDLSCELVGFYSGFSIHAAGVLLSDVPLNTMVPLEREGEFQVSLWDMESLQAMGLQKIDILGLRNLTLLKRLTLGKEPWDFGTSNRKTYEVLKKGYTTGIFQLESPFATRIVKSMDLSSINDVSIAIALNRPGPIKSGVADRYIKLNRVPGELERVRNRDSILSETNGFLVYQEQLLSIAGKELALSLDDGELLRRAISKKVDQILNRAAGFNSLPDEKRRSVYSFLMNFAGYAFNKSHSLCYALISYWLAYFKANRPSRFYGEIIKEVSGHNLSRLVAELRDSGVEISTNAETTQEGGELFLSIPSLLGYGELPARPEEESFFSFVRTYRRKLHAKDLERLIKSGYFDLYGNRKELLRQINNALTGMAPELKSIRSVFGFKEEVQEKKEYDTDIERALMELEALSFNLTFIEGPEISDEIADTSVTAALARLQTGLATFRRVDYMGKSYITDGRTFIEVNDSLPIQGYVVFKDGKPSVWKESVREVSRIVYGSVDRDFIEDASPRESVTIKVKGKTRLIQRARLKALEPDEILLK